MLTLTFFIIFWSFILYKIELSDKVRVSLEELSQMKSLLSKQVLGIKASNLRLYYTEQGKRFYFFLENLKLIQESFFYPISKFVKTSMKSSSLLLFKIFFLSS